MKELLDKITRSHLGGMNDKFSWVPFSGKNITGYYLLYNGVRLCSLKKLGTDEFLVSKYVEGLYLDSDLIPSMSELDAISACNTILSNHIKALTEKTLKDSYIVIDGLDDILECIRGSFVNIPNVRGISSIVKSILNGYLDYLSAFGKHPEMLYAECVIGWEKFHQFKFVKYENCVLYVKYMGTVKC